MNNVLLKCANKDELLLVNVVLISYRERIS